ncbi:methyltransferase domain-containing protein [Thiohalocapsa marina]|uniref:Methyltransferase domain-containing protein n=1 Tax=Thiohalocapsa marina TaxID=424902 RepID=A0A5M8FI74_9GAMM|nr:class I SAM-dependent methyltransferase [Thiohalocapsa marina]KAA6184397.1 methyltransferase domain-containing protein [Thiohalocapsa marina]
MDDIELLVDLHRSADRQGPGGDAETRRALELAGLDRSRRLKIADIGCGTGAASILLARELDAEVTAVDFLPAFLDTLRARAHEHGVAERITPLHASMEALPFAAGAFDVIWSEGAVYNMGFEAGISAWRQFLRPGGMLVVSEITWLGAQRPAEIQAHWASEYPQINVASAKIGILEQHGYSPRGYFVLPPHCWLENYYRPMQDRFDAFLARHGHGDQATAIVAAEQHEIRLYERYQDHYGYGVYVAQWPGVG